MADIDTKEQTETQTTADVERDIQSDTPNVPSANTRSRNYMILALILGLVGSIWVVTLLKTTMGAS